MMAQPLLLRAWSGLDPLVRLLLAAMLLASLFPAAGAARPLAQGISDAAIFCLFLLNGLRLPRKEVRRGIGHVRFLVPLAAWCFGAMALAGLGLARLSATWLPPEVALGLLFLGVLPSTVQSATAYSALSGGRLASSVVAAAVLNLAGVLVCAPLFALLAGGAAGGAGEAGIDLAALERIALILLLPFAIGQMLQTRLGGYVADRKRLFSWMDRLAIAIAVYVAFSGAVEQGLWSRVDPLAWAVLAAMVAGFLAFGFGGAWLTSGGLGLDRADRIAFLYAGAQKSIAIGAPLASVLFPPGIAGLVLLPVLLYHLLQLLVSALLASRFQRGG